MLLFYYPILSESTSFGFLTENVGLTCSDEEQRTLVSKYDCNKDGTVNYRLFCDNIDRINDPSGAPSAKQESEIPELVSNLYLKVIAVLIS